MIQNQNQLKFILNRLGSLSRQWREADRIIKFIEKENKMSPEQRIPGYDPDYLENLKKRSIAIKKVINAIIK